MTKVNITACFSDDLRLEADGKVTIVGIMPDNVQPTQYPFTFPKLCIYMRAHISKPTDVKLISASLRDADGEKISLGEIEIANLSPDESGVDFPYRGAVLQATFIGFTVQHPGRIEVICRIDEQEVVCAAINLR